MLVERYQAHVGAQKPRQQQYSSELAMEICNTKPILQYTQTAQSGMSWIADDTLLSFNLIDHLGTTIGHTLGLYSTANSQLYTLQRPTTSSEQLHIGKIGYKSRNCGYKTVSIWGGRLLHAIEGLIGTHQHKISGIKACLGAIHVQFYMIFSYFTYIFKNRRYFGPQRPRDPMDTNQTSHMSQLGQVTPSKHKKTDI